MKIRIKVCIILMLITYICCSVTVDAQEVVISSDKQVLNVGDVVDLDITGGSSAPVWYSYNPNIAEVNSEGEVQAVRVGQTSVRARVGNISKTCLITVVKSSVSLDKKSATIYCGGDSVHNIALKAKIVGASSSAIWTSSDENIALVDDKGYVTAVSEGTAVITVSANNKSADCLITVKNSSLELDITSMQLGTKGNGSSMKVTPSVVGSSKSVKWETSDKYVATVSGGKITGKKTGRAIITATANGLTKECVVDVVADSIAINAELIKLYTDNPEPDIKIIKTNAPTNAVVEYTSSDESVAVVDFKGCVTPIGVGDAIITAAYNGTQDTCAVNVRKTQTDIIEDSVRLETKGADSSYQLHTDVTGKTSREVYSTDNKSVVTVSKGKLTAKGVGTANVMLTANGKTDVVNVVVENYTPTIDLNYSKYVLYTIKGNSVTLKATVNGPLKAVNWVSSDEEIATVSNGVVKAKNAGIVTISATANGVTAVCDIEVRKSQIVFEDDDIIIDTNTKYQIGYDVTGYSQKVTWKSLDTKIASVKDGIITTAKPYGETDIVATANGISSVLHVRVKPDKEACIHKYDKGTVVNDSTCTEAGQLKRTCSICDNVIYESIEPKGHSYDGVWVTVTEATAEQSGLRIMNCLNCDYYIQEEIAPISPVEPIDPGVHEHSFERVTHPSTCVTRGGIYDECECGERIRIQLFPYANHEMGEWEVVKEPTYEEEGRRERKCANCEYYDFQRIPTLIEGDSTINKLRNRLNQKNNVVKHGITPCRGEVKALVFYISFKDKTAKSDRTADDIDRLFFDDDVSAEPDEYNKVFHSLKTFLEYSSGKKMTFSGITVPYTTSKNASEYSSSDEIFKEALDSFFDENSTYSLSDFDGNNDGYFDGVYFLTDNNCTPDVYGPTGYVTTSIGWGKWDKNLTEYMASAYGYSILVDTLAHETVHMMGIPDTYGNVGVNYSGSHGDSIMEGSNTDLPAIFKLIFGWYDEDNIKVVSEDTDVVLDSYMDSGDFVIAYPEKDKDSKFVFVAEYLTKGGINSQLDYLDANGGLRVWRVLLNVDEGYDITGNESYDGTADSPFEFIEAIYDFNSSRNYVLSDGEEWTPYMKPSSYYGTDVIGDGEIAVICEKQFSGISIKNLVMSGENAQFTVSYEVLEDESEDRFEYILNEEQMLPDSDGMYLIATIQSDAEIDLADNYSNSHITNNHKEYPVIMHCENNSERIGVYVSEDTMSVVAGGDSVLTIAQGSVRSAYGALNSKKDIVIGANSSGVASLYEDEGKNRTDSYVAYEEWSLKVGPTFSISDTEVGKVSVNADDHGNVDGHLYSYYIYNTDTSEVSVIELNSSTDDVVTSAANLDYVAWSKPETGDFEIVTVVVSADGSKIEYMADYYNYDGELIDSAIVDYRYFSNRQSNILWMDNGHYQKFVFRNNGGTDLYVDEYDEANKKVASTLIFSNLAYDGFDVYASVHGSEYTLSMSGTDNNSSLRYAHSYTISFEVGEEANENGEYGTLKMYKSISAGDNVPFIGRMIRLSDDDYVLAGIGYYVKYKRR